MDDTLHFFFTLLWDEQALGDAADDLETGDASDNTAIQALLALAED